MCARTHKCEACAEEYTVHRCCGPESPCGGSEWTALVEEVKRGLAPGSNASMFIDGPYKGQVNPCRFCQSYWENIGRCLGIVPEVDVVDGTVYHEL
ncbi:MAG: hypothetical protein AB1330_01475 [Bacillota bacterium]